MKKYNVCFIFDSQYLCQTMTAIKSLIINNGKLRLDIYAFVMDMDESDKERLCALSTERQIVYVKDVSNYVKRFQGIDTMGWIYATYIRLLLGELLPDDVKQVLYMDSDMIIRGSLEFILQYSLQDKVVGAVLDKYITNDVKNGLGLESCDPYFNAGILLINLELWRKEGVGDRCIDFLQKNCEANAMADQNALNVILKGRYDLLPLSYNVDGYMLLLPYQKAKNIMEQPVIPYYSENDYEEARKHPTIIHFIGWYIDKPWTRDNLWICGGLKPYAEEFEKYAILAGVGIPWKERNIPKGIQGKIREWTREGIRNSIKACDTKKVIHYYKIGGLILSVGSKLKKSLKGN